MTDFLQLVSTLREQMNATLSRTDVLKPLAWLIGILATLTVIAAIGKAPGWLLVIFTVFLCMSVCLYIGAYLYCLINDRDSLRSETYSLHKMAIEHGIYGDSNIGIIDQAASSSSNAVAVRNAATKAEESA